MKHTSDSSSVSSRDNRQRILLVRPTLKDRLGILLLTFFVMIIVSGLVGSVIRESSISPRNALLLVSVIQSILAFILPAWLTAWLTAQEPYGYLGMDTPTSLSQFGFAFTLLLLMAPFMNLVVEWNEGLQLPESMKDLYTSLRNMEDSASEATRILLDDTSIWGLISGIFVIGILTGFAEEIFFRGGLVRAMRDAGINVHVCVWSVAVFFSLLHFQFFGFVPRMLLGALFGYAYWFSRSIWLAAFMHAFNNSWVVFFSWLEARGAINPDFDINLIGTKASGQLWAGMLSLACAVVVCIVFGKVLLPPRKIH